jgi:hypothetical protein
LKNKIFKNDIDSILAGKELSEGEDKMNNEEVDQVKVNDEDNNIMNDGESRMYEGEDIASDPGIGLIEEMDQRYSPRIVFKVCVQALQHLMF